MGIPSYFSYIIKNHSNIIRTLTHHQSVVKTIGGLYMDCNSIIYDSVRTIEKTISYTNTPEFEQMIIDNVIARIRDYICRISPSTVAYVAFDGVAPFAKMEQQRQRRYKGAYMSMLQFDDPTKPFVLTSVDTTRWDTSAITPGTPFMENLSRQVDAQLSGTRIRNCTVIVSTSNEPGEGEHKMFDYIRDNVSSDENIVVYGLDSDLIMLSINHIRLCKNIYITREIPEFGNLVPKNVKSSASELLVLDIRGLCNSIVEEMGYTDKSEKSGRISDYVFLCFLLGNDFLPHIMGVNLRRNGMDKLLHLYMAHIGRYPERSLTAQNPPEIRWKWVNVLFSEIAKLEEQWAIEEYEYRNVQEAKLRANPFRSKPLNTLTGKDYAEVFQQAPKIYRADERYICPSEEGWETRYYVRMEGMKKEGEVKKMCEKYRYMLEWVFDYYNKRVLKKRESYEYTVSPLMKDIIKMTIFRRDEVQGFTESSGRSKSAIFGRDAISKICGGDAVENCYVLRTPEFEMMWYTKEEQLNYIMPQKDNDSLEKIRNSPMNWAYKNYLWESHIRIEK